MLPWGRKAARTSSGCHFYFFCVTSTRYSQCFGASQDRVPSSGLIVSYWEKDPVRTSLGCDFICIALDRANVLAPSRVPTSKWHREPWGRDPVRHFLRMWFYLSCVTSVRYSQHFCLLTGPLPQGSLCYLKDIAGSLLDGDRVSPEEGSLRDPEMLSLSDPCYTIQIKPHSC